MIAACFALLLVPVSGHVVTIYGYADVDQARDARDQIKAGGYDAADRAYDARPDVVERRRLRQIADEKAEVERKAKGLPDRRLFVSSLPIRTIIDPWAQVAVITAPPSTCEQPQ